MSEGFYQMSNMSTSVGNTCLDKANYGECTKGEDCIHCNNISGKLEDIKLDEVQFNTGAPNYIPKSKRPKTETNGGNEDKLNLNLNAEEYLPRSNINVGEDDAELEEENDMIAKDSAYYEAIEEEFEDEFEEEEESDEDKWFPKYKDCECCKGFVYKCEGVACSNMDMCYCKMKEECDREDNN